jgi:hypothetical protein
MTTPRKATPSWFYDLEVMIRGLRTVPPDTRIERCMALVKTLGQRVEIMSLIRGVLDDPALLKDIAGRSYPHVNKFDKIVLIGSSEPRDYRLTLHLWRPSYPESVLAQEMIHGHRFNFCSAIITGVLTSELFEERYAGPGLSDGIRVLHKYRYTPDANRTAAFQDFYEFEGRVGLASTGVRQKRAGDSYYLDATAIHRIILPRRIATCSLVLRGPRLSGHSFIYNTSYPRHDVFLKNKLFSPRELEGKLSQLMSALGER